MDFNNPFRYCAIQDDDGIRLIRIHPGNYREDIEISIDHHRLSESPGYEALSYTWGDSQERVIIKYGVHRQTLEITKNCAHAIED